MVAWVGFCVLFGLVFVVGGVVDLDVWFGFYVVVCGLVSLLLAFGCVVFACCALCAGFAL